MLVAAVIDFSITLLFLLLKLPPFFCSKTGFYFWKTAVAFISRARGTASAPDYTLPPPHRVSPDNMVMIMLKYEIDVFLVTG